MSRHSCWRINATGSLVLRLTHGRSRRGVPRFPRHPQNFEKSRMGQRRWTIRTNGTISRYCRECSQHRLQQSAKESQMMKS